MILRDRDARGDFCAVGACEKQYRAVWSRGDGAAWLALRGRCPTVSGLGTQVTKNNKLQGAVNYHSRQMRIARNPLPPISLTAGLSPPPFETQKFIGSSAANIGTSLVKFDTQNINISSALQT